jgi:hypothetical protein
MSGLRISKKTCFWLILFPVLMLLGIYLFHLDVYRAYFPYGDDPGGFACSDLPAANWLTRGFSNCFNPYPEWAASVTDLMRPGTSLVHYLNRALFGQRYPLYFLEFYCFQLAVAILTMVIGRDLGLSIRWRALIGALIVLSPSFLSSEVLISISGAIDLLDSILALTAFYLIYRKHYYLAIIPLAIGTFTKEAFWFAPPAACLSVWLTARRRIASACQLIPLALYVLVRQIFFTGSLGRIYAIPVGDGRALVLQLIKGVFSWPTGIVSGDAIKNVWTGHSPLTHAADICLILGNVLLWTALIMGSWAIVHPRKGMAHGKTGDPGELLVVWAFGSLAFGVIGVMLRYGAAIYPFELLLLAVAFHRMVNQRGRVVAAAGLFTLGGAFVLNATHMLQRTDTNLAAFQERVAPLRSLVRALRKYGREGDVIYVLNSPRSSSSPSEIARFFQVSSRIVILNEFEGCATAGGGGTTVALQEIGVLIHSQVPACASLTFSLLPGGTLVPALHGTLSRDSFGTYSLPEGTVLATSLRKREPLIQLGNRLDLVLKPRNLDRDILLYYDWATSEYDCFGSGCGRDD